MSRICYLFLSALLVQQSKAGAAAFVVVHPGSSRSKTTTTQQQQQQRIQQRLHLSPSNGISNNHGIGSADFDDVSSSSSFSSSLPSSSFQHQMGVVGGRYFDLDDNESDKELELVEREYQRKLAKAQEAMADVEAARQRVTEKMNNYKLLLEEDLPLPSATTATTTTTSLVNKRQRPSPDAVASKTRISAAKIEYSDAGTLTINIPAQGMSTNSIFAGAFSAAWFSAIVPATLTVATGGVAGALFMVPFWAAGGMVAKNAVVDPFVTTKISIGQYAYSLEKVYAGQKTIQKVEGSTDNLLSATVHVAIIVNERPQYALKLFDNASKTGIIQFGLGLSVDELQNLADEINECLERINEEKGGGEREDNSEHHDRQPLLYM